MLLDYETILANRACPVHMALRFTAPEVPGNRNKSIAFCLVIDRSASMSGSPLEAAKDAARLVVRNLRKDDLFSLILFDDDAQVLVPLQSADKPENLIGAIDSIQPGGTTNLTGGWMLGRDELKKASVDLPRRLLLLTDGHINVGIAEPPAVTQVVASGMERDLITTSCLGFGDNYNEDLLAMLANATGASYYDANSPDQLPAIFAAELEGLQALAVQNLRVQIKRLDFCDSLALLADYPTTVSPDDITQVSIGSLVSEEERTMVVTMGVPAIPLVADGKPAADLEGERLVEVEVRYDLLKADQVTSHEWKQTVRVLPVQEEKDLRTNSEVIGIVSVQAAGKTLSDAISDTDHGRVEEARERLFSTIRRLKTYPPSVQIEDGLRILQDFLNRLELMGHWSARERKSARYHSNFYRKMSSQEMWTGIEEAPAFSEKKRRPTSQPEDGETDS